MTGRLRFFHANWLNITRDQFILNAVQGFKICFRCTPVQSVVPRVSDQNSIIKNEIVSLLKKRAIRQVPFSHDGFYHRLFLVPKKGGGQRPVLDLSALNQFIETEHFKMENLVTLKSLLNKGDYMINLDLTDAYLTVPMHPDSRKFLRFLLGNKTYEFTAMPFGLNVAPRLFTKIMKPVVASLRSQGVRLIIYLDDILIIASSIETLNRHKTLAISLLESLGFLINYEKSNLTPSQQIVFLGMLVDSASMQFILPQQKAVQIQKECRLPLNTNRPTIRHLSRVLGLLEACRPAVWSAPLHYRQLQTLQISALQRWANYNAPVDLTPSAKSDLSWWVTTLQTPQESPIVPPIADLTISSDASKQGWGASWGSQRTGGLWSEKESQDHINVLELRAAFFALKSFLPTQTNKIICLKLDNTTAVSYLNNLGGTHCPQLLHLAIAIWDWCEKRHLFLLAQHIPGKTNVEADTESRVKRDLNDWRIPPKIIAPLIRDCTIDLFASRLTHQLKRYVSWRPDPSAVHNDAFTMDWSNLKAYAFPPFNLIPSVLQKAKKEHATLMLVAPPWTTQPWWPLLIELIVDYPVYLGNNPKLLQDVSSPGAMHPLFPSLKLAATLQNNGNFRKSYRTPLQQHQELNLQNIQCFLGSVESLVFGGEK